MKVLFIGPLPEPITGQSLACQVLLDELVKHHQVDVINLSKGSFAQGLNSFGRVLEVFKIIWRSWLASRQADVIYFTVSESRAGNAKDLLIFLVCLPYLRRMAIHLHGGAGMRRILRSDNSIVRALNAFFLRRLGAVIVLGETLKAIYLDIVAASRLLVIPNFAEDQLFANLSEIHAKFEAGVPLRLLFLSNLLPGKGHIELAQAFLSLGPEQRKNFRVDFAGSFEDDRQRDAFLKMIIGVSEFKYHGPVRGARKVALFNQAHIFCLPTYYPYEGQPISILEAYASGCAVLTTPHSGIPDVFRHAINGLQVLGQSPESIKRAIEAAFDNRDQLKSCALHNRREADQLYRSARYTQDVTRALEALNGGRGAAGETRI